MINECGLPDPGPGNDCNDVIRMKESLLGHEEACRRWRILESWTSREKLILPPFFQAERPGGREHDVRFDQGLWYKFTKPWCAGYTVDASHDQICMLPATPLQYLLRWRIANKELGDNVRLMGIAKSNAGCRLVISQPDIVGEEPSWEQVDHLFTAEYGMNRSDYLSSLTI